MASRGLPVVSITVSEPQRPYWARNATRAPCDGHKPRYGATAANTRTAPRRLDSGLVSASCLSSASCGQSFLAFACIRPKELSHTSSPRICLPSDNRDQKSTLTRSMNGHSETTSNGGAVDGDAGQGEPYANHVGPSSGVNGYAQ